MSLAGNLSDLSLPELLQVVALSRKTGALEICSEQGGVAWLGLRDGGIVRVALESGDLDRDEILRKAGLEPGGDSDVAAATLWDAAVQAILSIFDWAEGDFTFEPLDDPALQWRGPQGILLPSPLSPEFLALEGARLEDENAAQREAGASGSAPRAQADEPDQLVDEIEEEGVDEADEADEADADSDEEEGELVVEVPIVEPPPEEDAPPELDAQPESPARADDDTPLRLQRGEGKTLPAPRPAIVDPDATVVASAPFVSDEPVTADVPRPAARLPSSLICIDSDLPVLEKLKNGLAQDPVRVHIFQSAEDALARFKQYVVRGELPGVVLGSAVEDPLDARQGLGWRRFAGRLLAIAPRMRLVVLARPGESVAAPGLAVVQRPEPRAVASDVERFLRRLRDALASGT